MLRGRNLRTGLLVALGIATVSSGLIMALPVSLPDTWRVDSPGPPVVSEARAVAATTATPPNLDVAAAESRKVLNRSPLNATAWARLAWVADKRGDQSAMLDALDRSYVATPYSPNIAGWRLRFAFDRWGRLTPQLRRQVLAELNIARQISPATVTAVQSEVADPAGRLAIALTNGPPATQ